MSALINSSSVVRPQLAVKEIKDVIIRKNFQNLQDYFMAENQLMGFQFFDVTFTKAQTNFILKHGLSYTPQDVVVLQCVGAGQVSFNVGIFSTSSLNITTTGACRVRFLVGSYWNQQGSVANAKTDVATFNQVAGGMPSGVIIAYAGATAPSGYLLCDGTSYSSTVYPNLFAVIGTTYGGTGQTFNVPNYRGVFLRGAGSQTISKIAYSTTLAKTQTDQFQGHGHLVFDSVGNGVFNFGSGASVGLSGVGVPPNQAKATTLVADATNGTPRSGLETRPVNMGVNYIIAI